METKDQVSEFQALANAAGPTDVPSAPAPSAVAANGIVIPAAQPPQAGLTAPGPSSPTNAAPRKSIAKIGDLFNVFKTLATAQPDTDFGTLAVASAAQAFGKDTAAPSNTSWEAARNNRDATPATPVVTQPEPSNGQKVVNSIGANLGDLAAATEGGTAGGAFAGAARVARAQTNRQREEQENKIKMATANAQMLHEQQLLHKTSEDAVNASAAMGKQSADEMLTAPNSELLASGKTSDDLEKLIKNGGIDPSKDAVFLTGRVQMGTDANGFPQYRSVYSVIRPGDRLAPKKEQIDFLNENLPGSNFKSPNDEGTGGQTFDSHTFYMLNQRAMNNFAMIEAIKKNALDISDKEHKVALEKGDYELMSNDAVRHALTLVPPTKDGSDPFMFVKAYNILTREVAQDPTLMKELPKNWQEQFAHMAGGGDPKKFEDQINKYSQLQQKLEDAGGSIIDSYTKDPSKFEGAKLSGIKTAAQNIINDPTKSEAEKTNARRAVTMADTQAQFEATQAGALETSRSEAKKKSAMLENNPNGLSGEDFIKTLPPGRATALRHIAQGDLPVNPASLERTDKGQAFLDDIYAAYPDFVATKGMEWPAAWKENMVNGKTSQAKTNYNTALQHMVDIYATSTWNGLYNPASDDYIQRKAAADIVIGELTKAIKAGVPAEKELESMRDSLLHPTFKTADAAKKSAMEQTKLLKEKIDEYQTTFEAAAPSKYIDVPKLISSRAQSAFDYVVNGVALPEGYQETPAQAQKRVADQRAAQTHGGGLPQPGRPNPQFAGKIAVQTPVGIQYFNDQESADKFKTAAGLK